MSSIVYYNCHTFRLPYSQDQCGDLLSAQRLMAPDTLENTDDIYREEGDLTPDSLEEQIYLVPENYEQDQADFQPRPYIYNQDDIEDEGPTLIDDDFMPEEDQQEAWLHLQNVSTFSIFRFLPTLVKFLQSVCTLNRTFHKNKQHQVTHTEFF